MFAAGPGDRHFLPVTCRSRPLRGNPLNFADRHNRTIDLNKMERVRVFH